MENYEQVIHALCPEIEEYSVRDEKQLLNAYGPMTERELAQIHGRSKDEELAVLSDLEKAGSVSRSKRTRGNIWTAA